MTLRLSPAHAMKCEALTGRPKCVISAVQYSAGQVARASERHVVYLCLLDVLRREHVLEIEAEDPGGEVSRFSHRQKGSSKLESRGYTLTKSKKCRMVPC